MVWPFLLTIVDPAATGATWRTVSADRSDDRPPARRPAPRGRAETDLNGATALAEQLRLALREAPLIMHDKPLTLTMSLGAATLSAERLTGPAEPERALDALFASADDRLYTAKGRGRDAVIGA